MKRILIVDDEEHTRILCRRFLTRNAAVVGLGLEIHEAATGEEALTLLMRERFDCIISDYRMGAVSGIDVLAEALRTQPKAIRALMSGFADDGVVQGAKMRARIHEFIEKPMTVGEFERVLQRDLIDKYCGAA